MIDRLAAGADLVADGGLDLQLAAGLQAEIDLVAHLAGDPAVLGDPRHGGEAHAGGAAHDLEDGRHRIDAPDRGDVLVQIARQGQVEATACRPFHLDVRPASYRRAHALSLWLGDDSVALADSPVRGHLHAMTSSMDSDPTAGPTPPRAEKRPTRHERFRRGVGGSLRLAARPRLAESAGSGRCWPSPGRERLVRGGDGAAGRPGGGTLRRAVRRLAPDEASVPVREGGFDYSWRFRPGSNTGSGGGRRWVRGEPAIILDENELAERAQLFRAARAEPEPGRAAAGLQHRR